MNDDGGRRRLCKLHDAFEAQQVGTVQRAQQVEENVQRGGWHRGFAGEGERADALVVAVYVVGVAAGAMIRVGLGLRREPALYGGVLSRRVEQTAGEQALRRCLVRRGIEDRRGGAEPVEERSE